MGSEEVNPITATALQNSSPWTHVCDPRITSAPGSAVLAFLKPSVPLSEERDPIQ